jgi:uncharacterized protein
MNDAGQEPTGDEGPPVRTHLLVDGENIDATLGTTILGRRPNPEERPRWDRVRAFLEATWDQPVNALFFVNASSGTLPKSFIQALIAMGYTPIPLAGPAGVKVVDEGILRTLSALADRPDDVVLATHDADFVDRLRPLLDGRRIALLAFREFVSTAYDDLVEDGLTVFDLEEDADSFTHRLPRVRIIPLEAFDPNDYL